MKRDDLTSLALGGNKTRKLEFAMGAAQASGSDVIVTGGATQSNHCRLTAAAAAKLGLDCTLVLFGSKRTLQGNLLLSRLFGADTRFVGDVSTNEVDCLIPQIVDDLRSKGRRPFAMQVVDGPDSVFAVVGYVLGYLELARQLDEAGVRMSHLCVCTGSGATQAGLLLGAKLSGHAIKILGISMRRSSGELRGLVRKNLDKASVFLGCSIDVPNEDIVVYDQFVGPGYGAMTPEVCEAINLLARTSGILIDHVYAGKALSGVFGLIRSGTLKRDDVVVFVHTGGVPSIFAYADQLLVTYVSAR
jgi:1-aminocyclopropane-1-carboxylate deaminase/D-cysteine desulfhydrase-like pyridoxal-dependent ACC family enzyme